MNLLKATLFALVFTLAGCANLATTSPAGTTGTQPSGSIIGAVTSTDAQRTVFAAKSGYDAALTIAVAYRRLPECLPNGQRPCHDPVILDQIRKADIVAKGALDAAETIVRTTSIPDAAKSAAIQTANSALAALSALLSIPGVKQP